MRLFRFFIISVIIIFAGFTKGSGQIAIMKHDADSLVKLGSFYIYNVEFDKANDCFAEVIKRYPDHPAGYFLDAMVEWWRIWLYRHNETWDDIFLEKIDRVVELCDSYLDENPSDITALFFKGGAIGFRGRFYTVRKSWLNAANDGKNAFDILHECKRLAPGNHDIMLGTGIYNYFAKKFPEIHPVLEPIMAFLPRGDIRLGLLQLKAAAELARYADIEAQVIRLQIYYQFEKDYKKTYNIALNLHNRFPNNPYFQRYVGKTLIIHNKLDSAEIIWKELLRRYLDKMPGYDIYAAREGLYYVGHCLMAKGKEQAALIYLNKCVEASDIVDEEDSGFMVQAHLKIAKIYDKLGIRDKAVDHYEIVLDMENKQGSHSKARRYLKKPYGS